MRSIRLFCIVSLLVIALTVVGCAPAAPEAKEVPESMEKLSQIQDQGFFVYGLEAQYRPFEFRDDKDNIVGYDVDVANEIGKRMGVEARPVDIAWNVVLESLYEGQFDLVIGGMTANEKRYERVNFSVPYMNAGAGILVVEGEITEFADLDGKTVGSGEGTPATELLQLKADELVITFAEDIKTYDDDAPAYEALKTGRIFAYASTIASLADYASNNPGFEVLPLTSDDWDLRWTCIAFRKEDGGFRAMANGILLEMKEDGTLDSLQEKWFTKTFETPNTPPTW
jgi:polar amino acid transport system substrate-binding protein